MNHVDAGAALIPPSSATAHEAAGKNGALPSTIKPLDRQMRVFGRVYPVKSTPGDNLFLHHAIYATEPGEVLVVDCGGATEFGYWGEVMAVAAQARGIAGLVIAGGVRDSLALIAMGFPVFSAAICIRGTVKDPFGPGTLGTPIRIGEVDIHRGDYVIGDNDGVLILPAARFETIIADSRQRDNAEQEIFQRLRQGDTTIAIYDLPPLGKR